MKKVNLIRILFKNLNVFRIMIPQTVEQEEDLSDFKFLDILIKIIGKRNEKSLLKSGICNDIKYNKNRT